MGTTSSSTASASLGGMVHGGQNPISGSTVTLWAAGLGGYGAAATQLSTTTTNGSGNFTFPTYTCPLTTSTTASQMLYITAVGGQATAGISNANINELAAIGDCTTALTSNSYTVVNEETTIAGMFALNSFFSVSSSGGGSIGAPSSNVTGLKNAFATAANLVPLGTGLSAATTVSGAVTGYTTAPSVTITPDSALIALEANILAACVNSDPSSSTSCSTLEKDVSATAAVDTLQAAYYMSINPTSTVGTTSNVTALFNLASASNPFAGASSSAPTDWSIGVTYGSTSTSTAGVYLMNYPTYVAVDGSGNIWMVNDASTSVTSTANSITEMSPAGVPLAQGLTGAGVLAGPAGIAIDPSGNVFVPNYGSASALQTSVMEYTKAGATNTFTVNKGPQRITIDGAGDVFVLEPSYKGLGDLEEIPASSASGTTATTLATGLTTDFSNLTVDSNFTVWVTGGGTGASGGTSGYPYVYQFLHSTTSPFYPTTPSATTNTGGITTPEQAISVGKGNTIFIQNYGAETMSVISGTTSVTAATGSPFTFQTNLTKPEFQVTDGGGNIWVTDAATTTATPAGAVYEISSTGTQLSPATGYAHTYNEPYGIAVDGSGNVWVGAYNAAEPAGFITELVGAGVPTVTPIAAQLPATAGGTSKIATEP